MKRAFFDATTRRLKAFGLCERNEPGDIAVEVPEDFEAEPGKVQLKEDGKTIEAAQSPAPVDHADIENLEVKLKALALTFAQITNTPVATVRTVFRSKMEQLL